MDGNGGNSEEEAAALTIRIIGKDDKSGRLSPSPPSSAFASALQSPYISPRAVVDPATGPPPPPPAPELTPPTSCSLSDYIPTTTSIDSGDQKPGNSDRTSFSFPAPRAPFSPAARLRSCDVYIGFHGQDSSLIRFCRWLKAELELQGIASFVADRSKYSDSQSHEIADRIICSSAFGVSVVSRSSISNPFSIEEIRFFYHKRNLVPLFFGTDVCEVQRLTCGRPEDEFVHWITSCNEGKLEADDTNWRTCVFKAVRILKLKLGRRCDDSYNEESNAGHLPFPRNKFFVGRERELLELEATLFEAHELPIASEAGTSLSSEGFESGPGQRNGRYITLEAWVEPITEVLRNRQRQRRTRNGSGRNPSVICINGPLGTGKTELALEFAYRYRERYKKVLWIGGEARYMRQNILDLSACLGLDVSAESEKERGRIRSFEEQEFDAFQRVKRELFRDLPYLLVIDDLETERGWWEGRDLHDLIPRNTGAAHVIITTLLPRVMNCDPLQLQPLPLADSMILVRGLRRKDYKEEEHEVLRKFIDRLHGQSFGMWVVGSLLSELGIAPSALFEAIDRDSPSLGGTHDSFWNENAFLMKVMAFCFTVIDRAGGSRCFASRMALVGAWCAPTPISSALLAAAAYTLPQKGSGFGHWKISIGRALCLSPQARKHESESAILLIKLGLAKRTSNRDGYWIQFHSVTQMFAKRRGGSPPAKAMVLGMRKIRDFATNSVHLHLWASAFLVFGFVSEPPLVQLNTLDMVFFIKKTALPLAMQSFSAYSRCTSALELLKVSTDVLEEAEKSFVSQIQDWHRGALCWRKNAQASRRIDEYLWQEVTLLKATLLESRAKLLMRGGHFDTGEDLCRTCISIRTVMLGHNHSLTVAAQETLAMLVRMRSKII